MNVNINYLAVLVSAIANFVIGALWYGPVFGKPWLKLSGVNEFKPNPVNMILGFVAALLMSYVLDHALIFGSAYLKIEGLPAGIMVSFFNWIGFAAPITLGVVIYEKKSWKLWMLNNGCWLLSLVVMGIILSLWK
jgi:hypothetical protein